jgi:arginine decarboxylase
LDLFMMSGHHVEQLAGIVFPANVRRIFYGIEELNELHLSILEGVQARYQTPHFSNLQSFARRPVGTFHALPIARGKSIFKSHWIKEMGTFYGTNILLAETSSTAGGLDSLLEPTGNIKKAQQLAARCFGADQSYFVTNGTSTANKIVVQGLCKPDDVVIVDRNCHKSHHYGFVLTGAQPYYVDAYPLEQYAMYGAVPLRTIKEALLNMAAAAKLDRVKMVLLTNCTFDGQVYNVQRLMEECLAIKPNLVFLWDEAWFAYARFSPLYRQRTAMGAVDALQRRFASDAYRKEYQAFRAKCGEIDLNDKEKLLDIRLYPDPEEVKLRVYATQSTHKSLSCLRQGSMIHVHDEEFEAKVAETFGEAYMSHTSTSPNYQIIASLDAARRQAELEGYELVREQIMLALTLRKEVNGHPLISKYFRFLNGEQLLHPDGSASLGGTAGPEVDVEALVESWKNDEFVLDPTRLTLLCGSAGYAGAEFRDELMQRYDIQVNKTSRNTVLFQSNINNSRSSISYLIGALADIAREIVKRLTTDNKARRLFNRRVDELMNHSPKLPDFSCFGDSYRDTEPVSANGKIRTAYFAAYEEDNCEHILLENAQKDERLEAGRLISANFVIPYPPGFPILVPGQVVTRAVIEFMRKLDITEIHGFERSRGLKLLKQ